MTGAPRHRRRWLRWSVGAVVGVVVLVVAGLSIDAHLTTAPAMLSLPKDNGAGPSRTAGLATVDGVWNAGTGSIIGWRAQQVLVGQQSTLVGRTGKVSGSITISGGSVSHGSFIVDMAAITSSQSQSTQRSVFDVTADPTAMLVLTTPIALGTLPAAGTVDSYPAAGNLTVHGVTRAVEFTVSAEHLGTSISVLADIRVPFADWNISVPGVPFLADIQSPATVEVLLVLTQGAGNPVAAAS